MSLQSFKLALSIAIFFLLSSDAFSQTDAVGSFNRHVFEAWKGEYVRVGPYRVKGSPYLLGQAFPGSIIYKDGKTASSSILYDLYSQKAGMNVNNEVFEADVPIETFDIDLGEKYGSKKLLFKNSYVFGKPELKCFLNVLEEGPKAALLKAYKIKLVPDPVNTMDKDLKVFNQLYEYYYYDKSTKALSSIKLRKKDILKELGNEEFVKNYLNENNIDFSKEQDVVNMLKIYNRL